MATEIRVPRLAESISDAVLVEWLKQDGERVRLDEPIAMLETDKAAMELPSEAAGVLRHRRKVGDRVEVGEVIALIEGAEAAAAPAATTTTAPTTTTTATTTTATTTTGSAPPAAPAHGPAVRRLAAELGIDPAAVPGSGPRGRVLKEDLQQFTKPIAAEPVASPASSPAAAPPAGPPTTWAEGEEERVVPMSRLRLRIAERLVQAQHTAAILTTFNEVDMTAVMELRSRFKESFEKKHGTRLSFMSFFTRASVLALQQVPQIHAEVRGTDVVYKRRVHMGVAVQTPRGLVVPVVRDADLRSFAEIEREIARLAVAARDNRLTLQELAGGTFTVSNGGVFGSLLSTPILNPPQSGILGMHKIEKRPVVVDDQIVIRPMMYLALSYDHRIVDGEQAVTFLVSVKDRLEDPERMLVDM